MAAAASIVELIAAGFKFDPKDDVLVAHYLLRRLRGQPLPCDGIILEADPLSAPPWKLLEMYGRKNDAFFFAAGKARSSKDTRQQWTCASGGCWKGQKRKKSDGDGEKIVVPGTGEVIKWRKYTLNFHADGEQGSTGWVMDEYAVTAPTELASSSSTMAYHIRFTGHGKNSKKRKREEPEQQDRVAGDEAAATLPPPEHHSSPQPVLPTVVLVGPEATPSEYGSSGVMDFAAFQECTQELPFLVDDFINFPAEMSSSSSSDAIELDELLRFIGETPESICA